MRKRNKSFVTKHFNGQNKTVTRFCSHAVVRAQGRARSFVECSPVSCKDGLEVARLQRPRLPAGGRHIGSLLEKDILYRNKNVLLKLQAH